MDIPEAAAVCYHCGRLSQRAVVRQLNITIGVVLVVLALLIGGGLFADSVSRLSSSKSGLSAQVRVRTLHIAAGEWQGEPRVEVLGEVTNLTAEPLAALQCQADCRDAAGKLVDHYRGIAISTLPGGATLRFKLSWNSQGPIEDYHSAELRIVDLKPAGAVP